jgi:large subunit ribosomal protein L33
MHATFIKIVEIGRKPVWGGNMSTKIILACSNCASRNYTTSKNKSTNPVRLEVKKFCKTCGEHTLHRETK